MATFHYRCSFQTVVLLYNGLNIAGNEASSFQSIIDITGACGAIILMQYICVGLPLIIRLHVPLIIIVIIASCDLRKYDHVSNHRERLGWLPVDLFVRYCSLLTLFWDYYTSRRIPFNTAFEFGRTHYYETRCPLHHMSTIRPRTAFCQRNFWHKVSSWWNCLPENLFQDISEFHGSLFAQCVT